MYDKIYQVNEVFTPSSPAKLTFVERENLNKRIVRALKTKGMQIIIYGQSGSGKTTLLENKLFQVYDQHLKTSCMKGMSFEAVILDAFDQLAPFYLNESSSLQSNTIDVNIKANYMAINTEIKTTSKSENSQKYNRLLPPQLTAQSLARFMGAAQLCWILDDFHKIDDNDKLKLSQLMKVFMDMSNEFPLLKIICVGAVNTARQVIEYDNEMRNRVSEIKVPLMNESEIIHLMKKGFLMLNLKISSDCIYSDVYHYSSGLAAICHKLCLLMCESINVHQTYVKRNKSNTIFIQELNEIQDIKFQSESIVGVDLLEVNRSINFTDKSAAHELVIEDLSYAVNEYLDDASDTIKFSFDAAFGIDMANQVIEAISEGGDEGESLEQISEILYDNDYPIEKNKIVNILKELQCDLGGNIIVFDNNSHAFRFATPFFMTFARTLFEQSDYRHKMSKAELYKVYTTTMASLRRA